ncbi:DNA-binding protein [Nitrosopumilus piranensis]|uniref:DNA/RNA-binding protein Alba n=1 Tax=Nitrosopumilus piranensis TaxID=1582439 RepID=A0A0C5BSS8_9ARCH|nr:DNA-binding protein [Nitrosopumilus piranensis]AJM92833.1 DNA-binding protein [Nitrosopumilus piranensis]
MSDTRKSKDAEDILSEFDSRTKSEPEPEPQLESPEPEPQLESPEPEPQLESPEPEPQLESPEPEPQLESPEPEPQLESPEPEPQLESPEPEPQSSKPETPKHPEERNVIFVGTKPIMTYVSATLTQLSTRPTVTIKARGKRITQAVDVSQMIVKRMDSVGYVISDVRISSDSLTSQDGKQRNVSTMEIDISKE